MHVHCRNNENKFSRKNRSYQPLRRKKVKKILPVLDPENKAILLLPIEDDKEVTYGTPSNIDDKNRFIIPRWIRGEFGTGEAILLVDGDKHYIAPKTGHLLPHA